MPIRCITFDLDDTLWDCAAVMDGAEAGFYAWLDEHLPKVVAGHTSESLIAQRRDFCERHPELSHDFTRLRKGWLAEVVATHGYALELVEIGFRAFWKMRNDVQLLVGVAEMLADLQRDYRLGVISNGNADVHHIGIGHHFEFVVHAATAGVLKPDPLIFQHAVEAAGVSVEEIVHVGDDPVRDVAGAAAVGMHTVWVNHQRVVWPGGPMADAEISQLSQLKEVLQAW